MNSHLYILEPYKGINTRFNCPGCNAREKTFVRYIDTRTNRHVSPIVGRCNRESNCGYHYTPKQYFQDNDIKQERDPAERIKTPQPEQRPPSFIPADLFKASLKDYEDNNLVKFLTDQFGTKTAAEVIKSYFIATSKHWPGASVFWQIDTEGRIRTGKIMLYDPLTGKRVKKPYNHFTWVHAVIKQPDFILKQCLFGEHLLNDRSGPVAIVESEKTAIIASVYFPQFTWLASGGLSNLSPEKCKILAGRPVTLFPDLNGFDKWSLKAGEISEFTKVNVSDLLELKANQAERDQGLDLADYLLKFNYREFITPERDPELKQQAPKVDFPAKQTFFPISKKVKSESWDNEIKELEQFFNLVKQPTDPMKLNKETTITDFKKFVGCEMSIIKAQNGNVRFLPYLNRLQQLKRFMNEN